MSKFLIKHSNKAFTLIELLIVISIIGLLSSVILASLKSARAKARDAKRAQDMRQIQMALTLYYDDNNKFPDTTCPCGNGGWETSDADINQFLESLAPKYISKVSVDPINKRDAGFSFFGPRAGSYFYSYYRYPAGYIDCPDIKNAFSVLGFYQAESQSFENISRATCGDLSGGCPGGGIAGKCRDWNTEFSYSVMLKEND